MSGWDLVESDDETTAQPNAMINSVSSVTDVVIEISGPSFLAAYGQSGVARRGRPNAALKAAVAAFLATRLDDLEEANPAEPVGQDLLAHASSSSEARGIDKLMLPSIDMVAVSSTQRPDLTRSPLQVAIGCVLEVHDLDERKAEVVDEDIQALMLAHLGPESRVHPTFLDKADAASVNKKRKRTAKTAKQLANCALHCVAHRKHELESTLLSALPRSNLILYVEANRYDETPMAVSRTDSASVQVCVGTATTTAPGSAVQKYGHRAPEVSVLGKSSSPAKLLQIETQTGMLLRLPAGSPSKFLLVVGGGAAWIQLFDRGTAECIQEALLRTSTATIAAQCFR